MHSVYYDIQISATIFAPFREDYYNYLQLFTTCESHVNVGSTIRCIQNYLFPIQKRNDTNSYPPWEYVRSLRAHASIIIGINNENSMHVRNHFGWLFEKECKLELKIPNRFIQITEKRNISTFPCILNSLTPFCLIMASKNWQHILTTHICTLIIESLML